MTITTCTKCGVAHTAESWRRLERVGPNDCGIPDFELELRNCSCGTTLGLGVLDGCELLTEAETHQVLDMAEALDG